MTTNADASIRIIRDVPCEGIRVWHASMLDRIRESALRLSFMALGIFFRYLV
jgi:hypothetical protein